ncbi:hypothetical protein GCM10009756_27340 [Pseudokineococcus marinus]
MPHSTTSRAPRRATSIPATEMPSTEPADRPAITSPISAVLALIASLIAGVRDTHVAMDEPVTKNAANSATRLR